MTLQIEKGIDYPHVHDELGPLLRKMKVGESVFVPDETPDPKSDDPTGDKMSFGGRSGLNLLRHVEGLLNRHIPGDDERFRAMRGTSDDGKGGQLIGVRVFRIK